MLNGVLMLRHSSQEVMDIMKNIKRRKILVIMVYQILIMAQM
jgi:hypothetical protein